MSHVIHVKSEYLLVLFVLINKMAYWGARWLKGLHHRVSLSNPILMNRISVKGIFISTNEIVPERLTQFQFLLFL